jgi:ATP-binding cassette subfamily B protein
VAENIAYGRPGASLDAIHRAAVMAGAHEFIERMSDGYATKLVEGGQNLSGGQRIAIARALLTEAPIIVLDEPTSALDSFHEHRLMETLRSLKGQRTIIIVSHRLASLATCDQIFVIESGRIVEQGTHRELLASGERYAEMAGCPLPATDAGKLAAA